MAFFDNLTRKAQDVASVAGEKAKMAADTAKINMQIASEQREIEGSRAAAAAALTRSTSAPASSAPPGSMLTA